MITTGWLHNSLLSYSVLAPVEQPVIAMLSHKISSIMIIDNYVALKEWSKSSINHHTLHFELLIVNEDHHFHFLSFLGFKFTSSSAAVLRLLYLCSPLTTCCGPRSLPVHCPRLSPTGSGPGTGWSPQPRTTWHLHVIGGVRTRGVTIVQWL